MPKRGELTISKRTVDGLSVEGQGGGLLGPGAPGLRREGLPLGQQDIRGPMPGPAASSGSPSAGHGETTAEGARKKAAAAIARIKRGEDPVARPLERTFTIADLAERYMEGHVKVHCNAHTQWIYAGSLRNHILPALGAMPVASVGRAEVAALALRDAGDAPGGEPGADGFVQDVFVVGGVGEWRRRVATRAGSSCATRRAVASAF